MSALDRVGLFTDRMRQSWDVELWLRIMATWDVGFVDEPLALYRYHGASLTQANARGNEDSPPGHRSATIPVPAGVPSVT